MLGASLPRGMHHKLKRKRARVKERHIIPKTIDAQKHNPPPPFDRCFFFSAFTTVCCSCFPCAPCGTNTGEGGGFPQYFDQQENVAERCSGPRTSTPRPSRTSKSIGSAYVQLPPAQDFGQDEGLIGLGDYFGRPVFVFGKTPPQHAAEPRDCSRRHRSPPKGLGLGLGLG